MAVDKMMLLTIIVGVLVVVALFQALQLGKTSGELSAKKLAVGSASSSGGASAAPSSGSGAGSASGAGVASLPSMVGGC
ncbi:MAG: hypothetical protein AABW86_02155 [Candidatus Micrarchaeota archaeon]